MSDEKFNLTLLLTSLFLCLFAYIDSYLAPLNYSTEVIVQKKYFENKMRYRVDKTFELVTKNCDFDVTGSLYNAVKENDTIIIMSSKWTKSIQKVTVSELDVDDIYSVGFIRVRNGMVYTPILILFLTIAIILTRKLTKWGDRKFLPYTLLIASLIILGFHLGLAQLLFQ